jgi:hypothetical protein
MRKSTRVRRAIFLNLVTVLVIAASADGRPRSKSPFEYVGGTEPVPERCEGKLELTETALVFECQEGRVTVPYDSVTLMEYRSKVSRQVRKMRLNWVLKPPSGSSKHNLFFTVLYRADGSTHAVILKVPPEAMRPYLAEIDLRVGHRVDVERYY